MKWWLISLFLATYIYGYEKAVIRVPVADMLLPYAGNKNVYNELPCMGEQGFLGCPRVHQCLFNETVTVVQTCGDEVQVAVPSTFYGYNELTGEPLSLFWTLRTNIALYKDLEQQQAIPTSIDYTNISSLINEEVITLVVPWTDPVTDTRYSVGTRFVRQAHLDNDSTYGIVILHHKNQVVTTSVPRHQALVCSQRNKQDASRLFITLLETWLSYAKKQEGHIPYVWGGSSFIEVYQDDFIVEKRWHKDAMVICWLYENKKKPYTGFDCSELVLRAAQIAGLPYFYKNSSLASRGLPILKVDECIEPGDIIWVPGHLMIISDIRYNKLIEAAGYHKQYGDVHCLPLDAVFDGITTMKQLADAFHNKKALSIKNKHGKIIETHQQWSILKI
jgi:cell wall-associated NlpC family hydrolase